MNTPDLTSLSPSPSTPRIAPAPASRIRLAPSRHRIRDLRLAEHGRNLIAMAEDEMPGLMHLRAVHGAERPLAGARIAGSVHVTAETAVLIETLTALGAEVTWSGCNVLSTQDPIAAALVSADVPVFAWRGQSEVEYVSCLEQQLGAFADGRAPNLLIDDGGDLTAHVHERHPELLSGPQRLLGLSEETTAGVRRLKALQRQGRLRVPAICVNDSATKRKFDNYYGCRESLLDGLKRSTDVMIAGKTALVVGFGEVGKGCARALAACGARVAVAEVDPICALQAAMDGFRVCLVEEAAPTVDIVVTATGLPRVVRAEHLRLMRDGAILCNMGAFDCEIDVAWLASVPGVVRRILRPGVEEFSLPNGPRLRVLAEGRIVNLACATGHPAFVMSCSFTNQVLAQLELFRNNSAYPVGVHVLPRLLDEEVARLHLPRLGAQLSELTEEQAAVLGVPRGGPFKDSAYCY